MEGAPVNEAVLNRLVQALDTALEREGDAVALHGDLEVAALALAAGDRDRVLHAAQMIDLARLQ